MHGLKLKNHITTINIFTIKSYNYYYRRGKIYLITEKFEEAVLDFTKAKVLASENDNLNFALKASEVRDITVEHLKRKIMSMK